MMKQALNKLIAGKHLSFEEAEAIMEHIMTGLATPAQIAGFITALRVKGETPDEIAGFAKTMRSLSFSLETGIEGLVDTCGTGGDGARTFNISTAASFVAAAAGVPIAKHGNRAVSSQSGSADVLSELGVAIELTPEQAVECLKKTGICFLFAPLYHQAMKYAATPRQELGFRTVFNILGPLTNPAGAKRQVIGTFSADLPVKVAHVLRLLGSEHALIVHGCDGLDEFTITGETFVAELKNGEIVTYTVTPEELGLSRHPLGSVRGGSPKENAEIIRRVLKGEPGGARDIVVLNAAASIYVAGKAETLEHGVRMAEQAIDSGSAYALLSHLCEVSQQYVAQKELA
jgi:anthranilate phosphoribosyltransferase